MSTKTTSGLKAPRPKFTLTQAQPPEDVARCVISESGTLIHTNDTFLALTRGAEGTDIRDLFSFTEGSMPAPTDLTTLPSGEHLVRLKETQELKVFRFDWLTNTDGALTLIASALENHTHTFDDAVFLPLSKKPTPITDQDFLRFTDMTHDVMVITDLTGTILKTNDAFKRNFLNENQSENPLSFIDLFSAEDKPNIRATMQALAHESGDFPINIESRILTPNGETRWVEWRQKYVDGHIYSSGRDITDIRRKHDALLKRQKQLSEAEAIGRMGHWRWPIGEETISWSEEIYRIFGLEQGIFHPTLDSLNRHIHKRDVGRVKQVFQRAMIEEQNYDMEFRIIRPDSEVRFIHCEGRCEKDEAGEVIALYGIMQDMTERMLYEQELKEAKNASEQAYAAKSRFLANMSHELRTPLNAIIGFSEMINGQMLGPIFNEKYLEYAKNITESGEHLLDLISDILDMSKIEAGKYTLDLEDVGINAVMRRAIHMIEGRAMEQGIRLRTNEIEGEETIIKADRRALTQIFLNLLSNAVKFTKNGGSVWIEKQIMPDSLTIRICDNGIGIPAHKLASVLRPFEQASSHYTREYEGTGLGLSITKELVELHGGTLSIDSIFGSGTNVSFQLPLDSRKKYKISE